MSEYTQVHKNVSVHMCDGVAVADSNISWIVYSTETSQNTSNFNYVCPYFSHL